MDAGDKYLNVCICLTQLNTKKNYILHIACTGVNFDLAMDDSTKILHSYKTIKTPLPK